MTSRLFPLLLAALALGSCARSTDRTDALPASDPGAYFGDVTPPAEDVFSYTNGAEPERIDPGLMSGQPDGRIARMLFEGLTVPDPKTLEARPGQAYRWDLSPDGLTYTFHLRPGIVWSDGRPVTSQDFLWSWLRVLRPVTASRYATFLYPVVNGEAFNKGELTDSTQVGLSAPDDSTFVVRLHSPVSYFLALTYFYTCLPVPRHVLEVHGPRWTRKEYLVNNGAFSLDFWRQNDRFELVRNQRYWDAAHVKLDRVVAYSIDDLNTCTNLYKAGVTDWNPSGYVPSQYIPYVRNFRDYRAGRYQATYFYSINTTKKPYDDVWVRRALNYAVDRAQITQKLLHGSRDPWGNVSPSGYPGYTHPKGVEYDPVKARECLAKAGYPGGKGFPKVGILFNTSEDHRRIAEAIQAMWRRELNIEVELQNQEWGSYLQATTSLQYDVARRSWIGDYLDPNTFLEMWRPNDGNNRTGWDDPKFTQLLAAASGELDPAKRMERLAEAEAYVLDAAIIIPIYHYATVELIKPYVRGLYQTALDVHPIKDVWIDHDWKPGAPSVAERTDDGAAARGTR